MAVKDEKYERARERVKELKDFYIHVVVYVAVIAFLFFIDSSDGGNWWFQWVAVGWGIFIVVHWFNMNKFGQGWEELKIQEIMDKEK